ncbi:hypothetical protein [Streptomyces virginiae]|nr:hypothetical protein OG253_25495 [Streptomyces virginiae]
MVEVGGARGYDGTPLAGVRLTGVRPHAHAAYDRPAGSRLRP